MGKRIGKYFKVDQSLVNEFVKICEKRDIDQADGLEELLKQFIAKDGQITVDDIYAPRIGDAVKLAVDAQVNRMAAMLNSIDIDVKSILYGLPAFHKLSLQGTERTLVSHLDERLVKPSPIKESQQFDYTKDGFKMIEDMRSYARTDISNRRKKKKEATH
ncbi:hypothetical protein [Fictibacillus sp. NRS-1165]|uniref:hypothetical protein n=1 Tax=Fictibacillus sp. NRS-1165 TaxID=3144463 RepID=UPI003D234218